MLLVVAALVFRICSAHTTEYEPIDEYVGDLERLTWVALDRENSSLKKGHANCICDWTTFIPRAASHLIGQKLD
jgi:hypothetical protein